MRPNENDEPVSKPAIVTDVPKYVQPKERFSCGAYKCKYKCSTENVLRFHLETFHSDDTKYKCTHCHEDLSNEKGTIDIRQILEHLHMHDRYLYRCYYCKFIHYAKEKVEQHVLNKHDGSYIIAVREMSHEQLAAPVVKKEVKKVSVWYCSICKYRSIVKMYIIIHMKNKHNLDSQFKCPVCPYTSDTRQNVSNHLKNEHPQSTCDVVYTYYTKEKKRIAATNLFINQKKNADTDNYSSEKQTYGFEGSNNNVENVSLEMIEQLDAEVINVTGIFGSLGKPYKAEYVCPLCNTFKTCEVEDITNHLYEELDYSRYSCMKCDFTSYIYDAIEKHYVKEHLFQEIKILPSNFYIEDWVKKVISFQSRIIASNKSTMSSTSPCVGSCSTDSIIKKKQESVKHG
ncbi:hypothetical protein RN001_016346 [Aquatica leii]|uniref:C2H2-type domain-containing protein n=1 Tax=Aquatica leii TaxID=1421715 RepID=A0AAN7SBB9_9COLE|nr:hypothetical protein RN001_016346 [Aquatica leii]